MVTVIVSARPTRLQVGLWALVMAVMTAIVMAGFDAQAPMGSDGSHYVVLAEGLAAGDGFILISRPKVLTSSLDDRFGNRSPFPWGYPLLLAPLVSHFPDQFDLLRLPSLVATLLNGALLFWGWRLLGGRSYGWGLAVAGLYCLSPLTISLARRVFSEAIFTTFLLASILLIEYAMRRLPAKATPRWWWPVTSGMLTMMVFTRSAGWAMLAGLGLYVLLKRRSAGIRMLALLAAGMVAWTALVVSLTPVSVHDLFPIGYVGQFQGIVEGANRSATDQGLPYAQVLLNLAGRRLQRDLPSVIAPGLASQFTAVLLARWGAQQWLPWLGLAISSMLILGFSRWLRQERASAWLLAAAPYLLLLLAWRVLGPRLLYPVQPQIFYAFLLGGDGLLAGVGKNSRLFRDPETRQRIVGVAAIALILVYGGVSILTPGDGGYAQALSDRGHWFRTKTPANAIIMALQPEMDYLYSRRQGLPYPKYIEGMSAAEIAALLQANGIDYLVVEGQTGAWEVDVEKDMPQRAFKTNPSQEHLGILAQTLQDEGWLVSRYVAPDGSFRVYAIPTPATAPLTGATPSYSPP